MLFETYTKNAVTKIVEMDKTIIVDIISYMENGFLTVIFGDVDTNRLREMISDQMSDQMRKTLVTIVTGEDESKPIHDILLTKPLFGDIVTIIDCYEMSKKRFNEMIRSISFAWQMAKNIRSVAIIVENEEYAKSIMSSFKNAKIVYVHREEKVQLSNYVLILASLQDRNKALELLGNFQLNKYFFELVAYNLQTMCRKDLSAMLHNTKVIANASAMLYKANEESLLRYLIYSFRVVPTHERISYPSRKKEEKNENVDGEIQTEGL